MRRMQAVPLLTREGEIVLAREIETGRHQILHALAGYPAAVDALLARHRATASTGAAGSSDDDAGDTPAPASYDALQAAVAALRGALHAHGYRSDEYRDARNHVAALLGSIPLVFLAELGLTVALGILLDTMIVRSVLVTALNLDLGQRIWWPSSLAKVDESTLTQQPDPWEIEHDSAHGRELVRD